MGERDEALAERRRRRLALVSATAIVAAVLAGIAIAIGQAGGDEAGTTTGRPEGAAETRALFAGLPQRGIELGSPRARVTMVEFADVQCPFCGKYAREVLPELVMRYVRTGRLRMAFRNLAFLGPDSERGARMAAAAGHQARLWQFVDLVFRNQGAENAGWVTDDYLERVGAAAGLDVRRALAERDDPAVTAELREAAAEAQRLGVKSTPSFVLMRPGREPEGLDFGSLSVGAFTDALDEALAP
ncbi:MAG TPA: DsbA family protein [Thermoleophilaceae bacterium]|jgi:protein-disulfide isomerase